MELLDTIKAHIEHMGKCSGSFYLASAAASACNPNYGISLLSVAGGLDYERKKLVVDLMQINTQYDYSNAAQYQMLLWLKAKGLLDHTPRTENAPL